MASVLGGSAGADQILDLRPASFSQTLPAATGVQDVQPAPWQRGVLPDGSLLAGSALSVSIAGAPGALGSPVTSLRHLADIDLATGTVGISEVDLSFPARVPWIVGRTYNGAQQSSSGARDSNGCQGWNWSQLSQAELVADSTSSPTVIYLVHGADRFLEFRSYSSTIFRAVNGAAGALELTTVSGTAIIKYHDPTGHIAWFFGLGVSNVPGQLWKTEDPAGNAAYAGDPSNPGDAISNGFDTSASPARLVKAYDSAGRRYCYDYSTSAIGGALRLVSVVCETRSGTTWGSCGSETLVGRVDYEYYTSSTAGANGSAGDLRLVRTTLPQSVSGADDVRRRYYRYYPGPWANSAGQRGCAHTLRLTLAPEACRRLDWDNNANIDTSLADADNASDAALATYTDAYYEYNSGDRRVAKAWFDGESDGTYTFSYESNATSNAPTPSNATYEDPWLTRTVVTEPFKWCTYYFDEFGQPLSRVYTDADPAGSPNQTWALCVKRNSAAQVSRIGTPASVESYAHSGSSAGDLPLRSSEGLVYDFGRVSSGDLTGLLQTVRHRQGGGTSGDSPHDVWLSYWAGSGGQNVPSQSVGGFAIVRPLVSAVRRYPDESNNPDSSYTQTTFAYTLWGGASPAAPLAVKTVTTTYPDVSTAHHGPGDDEDFRARSSMYFTPAGDQTFAKAISGNISYRNFTPSSGQLDDGVLRWRVTDADTDRLTTAGITIPSGFDMSTDEGTPYHQVTSVEHDPQGRATVVTRPGGRRMRAVYTRLADMRLVGLYLPRAVEGTTPVYNSPVQCRVFNHAGVVADTATIRHETSHSISSSPTGWISTSGSTLVGALNSSLRLSTWTSNECSRTGARLLESHRYQKIYAETGQPQVYLITSLEYDDAQRLTRVYDPTCTITELVYDTIDRITTVKRGVCELRTPELVDIESFVYDGGSSGGNSYLTHRTGNANVPQTTDFVNDYQGRHKAVIRGEAPHLLLDYDNLDRVVAAGLYGGDGEGLGIGVSPLTLTDDRQGLMQAFFDERGRVYQRRILNPGVGLDLASVDTNFWYSPEGHPLMAQGETIEKYEDDRACRTTATYTLARTDSTTYAQVYAGLSANDVVIHESHTAFDPVLGLPRLQMEIDRLPENCGDPSWPGRLSPEDIMVTAEPVEGLDPYHEILVSVNLDIDHGKAALTGIWYDELDRPLYWVDMGDCKMPPLPDPGLFPGFNAEDALFMYWPGDPPQPQPKGPTIFAMEYTPDGYPGKLVDPNGIPTTTFYDDFPHAVQTIKDACAGEATGPCDVPDPDEIPCSGQRVIDTIYDDRGRPIMTILTPPPDPSLGPNQQKTRYFYRDSEYFQSGLPTGMPESDVEDNNRVLAVTLPDSIATPPNFADAYLYGYNQQGRPTGMRDPGGNVFSVAYDARGRVTRQAVTPATGYDSRVRAREIAYGWLGLPESYASRDSEETLLDLVSIEHDVWGNITSWQMDPDSTRGSPIGPWGLYWDWDISYPSGAGGGTEGWTQFTVNQITLPGGMEIIPSYGGDCTDKDFIDTDQILCRVSKLGARNSSTSTLETIAIYGAIPPVDTGSPRLTDDSGYWGEYKPSRVRLPKSNPDIVEPRYAHDGMTPATPGSSPLPVYGMDWHWDIDRDSWFRQPVATGLDVQFPSLYWEEPRFDAGSRLALSKDHSLGGFDRAAGYGCNNEIIYCSDGTDPQAPADFTGPGVGPPPSVTLRTETWYRRTNNAPIGVPDQTGNWSRYRYDSNAQSSTGDDEDDDYAAADDFRVSGTFNAVNEVTAYTVTVANGTPYTIYPGHDASGNLTDDGEKFRFTYDPFGRLVQANRRNTDGSPGDVFARFTYNALGYRTSAIYDLFPLDEETGQPAGDGDLCNDNLDWYVYDEQWRLVAVYRQGPGTGEGDECSRSGPQLYERYVYHAAGIGGATNSYGADQLVMRQRDTASPYGTLNSSDEVVFYQQNRRGDVVCVATGNGSTAGKPLGYVRYSAYGVPYLIRVADYDNNLSADSQDFFGFVSDYLADAAAADINRDGVVNSTDYFDYLSDFFRLIPGTELYDTQSAGRGVLSTAELDNHIGYAGYWWDPYLKLYHVRNRAYDPYRGRWLQRDPIGYAGGPNLYQYCGGDPLGFIDPFGLDGWLIARPMYWMGLDGVGEYVNNLIDGVVETHDWATGKRSDEETRFFNSTEAMASRQRDSARDAAADGRMDPAAAADMYQHIYGDNLNTRAQQGAMIGNECNLIGATTIAVGTLGAQFALSGAIAAGAWSVETVASSNTFRALVVTLQLERGAASAEFIIAGQAYASDLMAARTAAGALSGVGGSGTTIVYFMGDANETAPTVQISRSRYPTIAEQVDQANMARGSNRYTIDRAGAAARREQALRGIPTQADRDRSEEPPAIFLDRGQPTIWYTRPGENRGAGSSTGHQIRLLPDGTVVIYTTGP